MWDCVSVDLEVSRDTERIHKFAGQRRGGDCVVFPGRGRSLTRALGALDGLAEGSDFVLGHNLINFDLPRLRRACPGLRLLGMPVVDTLWLNPLAFPAHPYHALVKHYQDGLLIRERINDPLLDVNIALRLFDDQQQRFLTAPAQLLAAWHWLTTVDGGPGFDMVFESLRGAPRPRDGDALETIRGLLVGVACDEAAPRVVAGADGHAWPLAYVLAWLSVADGKSVMPPWVRHEFPDATRVLRRLRSEPCDAGGCVWCRTRHDSEHELGRFFGFGSFRAEPKTSDGRSLQKVVVDTAMRGGDALAVLPTGTGKSLCYQIPALSRYDNTGALTVVISPLVALMADQVRGLEKLGIGSCVTANSLLTQLERTEALDKVRLGEAAILLISPEQLRSVSTRRAVQQREVGAWVIDEAHCLAKWGHDFRPDYRYVARFVRSEMAGGEAPPVLCLTATAKPAVRAEIVDYFKQCLDVDLAVFDGGTHRPNLRFDVVEVSSSEKFHEIRRLLDGHLSGEEPGGAIVYCATRKRAEDVAGFLVSEGVAAGRFHAGLAPEERQSIQQAFVAGELRVLAATNAFGMGIDKPDVRLVVHAELPASLENYFQEAGRAGRDGDPAHCVLLYDRGDVEWQFSLAARDRLTRREIAAVLRALRALARRNKRGGKVVATAGEILADRGAEGFRRDIATDDSRLRTAVAWLEEATLLTREENHVRIFPSALLVSSFDEAAHLLRDKPLSGEYRRGLLEVAHALLNASEDEGLSTDDLMAITGLRPERVRGALYDLDRFGIAGNDLTLTAYVHVGVKRPSRKRLRDAARREDCLLDVMRTGGIEVPVGGAANLNVRLFAQRLKDEVDADTRADHVTRLLRSIDRDGKRGGVGGLSVYKASGDTIRIMVSRDWSTIIEGARRRRACAGRLLDHLLGKNPRGHAGKDILVSTTLGALTAASVDDPTLFDGDGADRSLVERALLWLHEQDVVRLNHGLTVLRPAVTIMLSPEPRGFTVADFEPLKAHYDAVTRQINIMDGYARCGVASMEAAGVMAADYFSLDEADYLERWHPRTARDLQRQTTTESWDSIVDDLHNAEQRSVVTDDHENTNVLVLAGPGSGKTRVLVHRIAYLVRVRRDDPRGILALAYNRHAAVEIRRRLDALIGDDARKVMVLTCHALAMRLVGASFATGDTRLSDVDIAQRLRTVIADATSVLRGDADGGDAADIRERLLGGFRWILVDEYQDIGAAEYGLISAVAGRTSSDVDSRLGLFAVGDDDQNIYAFNGSSVEFIRRFEDDYKAKPVFLTANYRSTRRIIDAANAVIAPAPDRMKAGRDITVDPSRVDEQPGGDWSERDPAAGGNVHVLCSPTGDPVTQARVAVAELQRLAGLDDAWDWAATAIIARNWRFLDPVRAVCTREGIPAQMADEKTLSVWYLRETQALIAWLRESVPGLVRVDELRAWLRERPATTWGDRLIEAADDLHAETSHDMAAVSLIEWFAEWSQDTRQAQRGVLLSTAHRAKGLEFDHVVVLDGGWGPNTHRNQAGDVDEARRLYYVAMTRARRTLTLLHMPGPHPLHDMLRDDPSTFWNTRPRAVPPSEEHRRQWRPLSLKDVYLSFAGAQPPGSNVHRAIAALKPGDPLTLSQRGGHWYLQDSAGTVVGRLSQSFTPPDGMMCIGATVRAVATWTRDRSDPKYRPNLRCDTWEVVVPELVFEPPRGCGGGA